MDESLSEIDRCALYLQSDEPLQVTHAFQTLPKLIGAQGRAVLTPIVCKHLKVAAGAAGPDPRRSIVLAESLQTIVEQHLLPVSFVFPFLCTHDFSIASAKSRVIPTTNVSWSWCSQTLRKQWSCCATSSHLNIKLLRTIFLHTAFQLVQKCLH